MINSMKRGAQPINNRSVLRAAVSVAAAAATLLSSSPALADQCEFYKRFIPSLADRACGGGSGGRSSSSARSAAASAGSSFAGSFNMTPAATPTDPTPYGVENIFSQIRTQSGQINNSLSLVKGFQKFGTAVSTAGNNTFYGNDVLQRSAGGADLRTFEVAETGERALPHFNLGTAFSLNPKRKGTHRALNLGVSVRYNSTTETVGPGLGLSLGERWLTLGVGLSRERISTTLPALYFASAMATLRLPMIEFEYSVLQHFNGPRLDPITILTGTINLSRVYLTAAQRKAWYATEGIVTQYHYAIQARLSRHFAAGILHNFIPGTNSAALQIFL
jgi:hypothetical protein